MPSGEHAAEQVHVGRIFCGKAAKNRAIKASGGCQGSGFASGSALRLRSPPIPVLPRKTHGWKQPA
jgi:hypothetical protein